MTASYGALSGSLELFVPSPEINLLKLQEAWEANAKDRQRALDLLEKAYNEKDRKKRLSFDQFCTQLLYLVECKPDGKKYKYAAIASFLLKKPGDVRKYYCLGKQKLLRVVGV